MKGNVRDALRGAHGNHKASAEHKPSATTHAPSRRSVGDETPSALAKEYLNSLPASGRSLFQDKPVGYPADGPAPSLHDGREWAKRARKRPVHAPPHPTPFGLCVGNGENAFVAPARAWLGAPKRCPRVAEPLPSHALCAHKPRRRLRRHLRGNQSAPPTLAETPGCGSFELRPASAPRTARRVHKHMLLRNADGHLGWAPLFNLRSIPVASNRQPPRQALLDHRRSPSTPRAGLHKCGK